MRLFTVIRTIKMASGSVIRDVVSHHAEEASAHADARELHEGFSASARCRMYIKLDDGSMKDARMTVSEFLQNLGVAAFAHVVKVEETQDLVEIPKPSGLVLVKP